MLILSCLFLIDQVIQYNEIYQNKFFSHKIFKTCSNHGKKDEITITYML